MSWQTGQNNLGLFKATSIKQTKDSRQFSSLLESSLEIHHRERTHSTRRESRMWTFWMRDRDRIWPDFPCDPQLVWGGSLSLLQFTPSHCEHSTGPNHTRCARCFHVTLCHAVSSTKSTLLLSNSLLISSQPSFYLAPLCTLLQLLQIFSTPQSDGGGVGPDDRCGKGCGGQTVPVTLSLPLQGYAVLQVSGEIILQKWGLGLRPLKSLCGWRQHLPSWIFSFSTLTKIPLINLVGQSFLLSHLPRVSYTDACCLISVTLYYYCIPSPLLTIYFLVFSYQSILHDNLKIVQYV